MGGCHTEHRKWGHGEGVAALKQRAGEFHLWSCDAISYKNKNIQITPINNEQFISSLAESDGLLTAGGFESPAEAIHLRKKVMMIPMSNQYEQQCNALAAKDLGVTVHKEINLHFPEKLKSWLNFGFPPNIFYPDITGKIIEDLMVTHSLGNFPLAV